MDQRQNVKKVTLSFINELLDHSVHLDSSQKETVLLSLHYTSTKENPFCQFYKLKRFIGQTAIQDYLAQLP